MTDFKRGPGRPATNKVFAEAYAVWVFVRACKARGDNRQTALWRAEERFGLKRATLEKRLWLVNETLLIAAHLDRDSPGFEQLTASLYRAGWFADD